jgi:hypothetical protein
MTQSRLPGIDRLPSAERKMVILLGLLRASTYTVLLVGLYYALPLGALSNAGSVVVFSAVLAAVVGLLFWQIHAILRARYPGIQAAQALATVMPLFLLLFSTTYFLIERAAPGSFTQRMTRTDALYFTVTTFSTVGYGDITALTDGARIVVTIQMLADLALLGFGVRVLFSAVQLRRETIHGSIQDT